MEDETAPKIDFTAMAAIGLYFIVTGLLYIVAFAMKAMGHELPPFLEYRSEYYGLLLMGIVNVVAAIGLLYRSKTMWSTTIVFTIVMLVGSLLGLFFNNPLNIIIIAASVLILIYMFTGKAKLWYGIQ